MHMTEPPLLLRYTPDQAGLEKCGEFGKKLPKNLCFHINIFLKGGKYFEFKRGIGKFS